MISIQTEREAMAKAKTNRKDYLSGLPDEILHLILSHLPSTKEAIKTSVLSKRWQLVWTHVPNLIFLPDDFLGFYKDDQFEISCQNVLACLDKTLSLYSSSKVEKFCMKLEDMDWELVGSRRESWLSFAIGGNVGDFTLDFYDKYSEHGHGYNLPECLYRNSCLLKLDINCYQFVPNMRVSWESLKDLTIGCVTLTDELVQNILEGTPVLYSLKFFSCCGFERIDLSLNSHLKKLVIEDYYDYNSSDQLHISGPYLEDLEILGGWFYLNCKLMNISCLVRATLDFEILEDSYFNKFDYQDWMMELLKNVCHIKQLKLGNWCVQVISTFTLNDMWSVSSNHECLIFNILCFGGEWIPAIANLLHSAYKLEKFLINFGHDQHTQLWTDEDIPRYYWSSRRETFNCLEFHLKAIEIFGLTASGLCSVRGFEFLKFLLAKSKVLETMVIHDLIQKTDPKVAQKLLSLPRSSARAVLVLK